ncbi:TorD/DmsD family molecular chaperone [Paracraurococcus lichenis]|uniref:Molecular chaperone TorD family protein n=1 Tax=Paracraurococcus lichenis TaxID=3064888 RepID=A0ABT9DWB2_9PROT|nr:molecular chaperone TorD family protein [Paracraurococcus sp. LOR1-02]MDO9708190.1 molecular chaperone TorD family protein [Paracraurococcus sp. LOR1-02]
MSPGTRQSDPVDAERAQLFALLARLLVAVPEPELLQRLAALPGNASPVGEAIGGLARAAASAELVALEREYFALFTGLGRGELLPYASYYLTGFLHERPLAELRGDLARLGIARRGDVTEPEDHMAFLCETLAGLIEGRLGKPAEAEPFFRRHMRPWAARFFADLEGAEAARFYRSVGALGRVAVEIEQAAADLPG